MATYYTNADGLVQHYGPIDTVRKARKPSTTDVLQTVVLDIVGTDLAGDATTGQIEGGAMIPAGAHIVGATFHVTTPFAGATATMDIGVYNALTQATVDDAGIDAAIAVTAIDAIGDTIACDGADIDTIVGAAPVTIAASYDTAAFTAGVGKLIVEYYAL